MSYLSFTYYIAEQALKRKLIKKVGFEIVEEDLHMMHKIIIETVLFNLRDHNGIP